MRIAYELSNYNQKIILWADPKDNPASHAATGVATMKGLCNPESTLFMKKHEGHLKLETFLKSFGNQVELTYGVSEILRDEDEYRYLTKRIYRNQFRGLFRVDLDGASSARLKQYYDAYGRPLAQFYYPRDYFYSVPKLLESLQRILLERGVEFRKSVVSQIKVLDGPQKISVVDQHAVTTCSSLVIANGAGVPRLLAASGLPKIPMQQVHGETLLGELSIPSQLAVTQGRHNLSILSRQVRIGSTSYRELDDVPRTLASLRDALDISRLPLLQQNCRYHGLEYGIRTRARDLRPIVGPLTKAHPHLKNIYVVGGLYKSGYSLIHDIAEHIASAILQQRALNVEPSFHIDRFL